MGFNARWRAARAVVATLLLAVLLGGCIEVRIESVFEEDLSARHALQTTIEREGFEQLAAMGGEEVDFFEDSDEIQAEAEAAGLDYEQIDTDEHVGWRVSRQFDDSRDVGQTLNTMFADSDPEAEQVNTFAGTIEQDGDTYRLNLTVNSDDVFDEEDTNTEDLGMDPGEIFAFVYIVTMPGEVTETNGERVGDNQVRWDLPLTGTTELMAVSKAGGSGGISSSVIIIAIVAALVLAGIAALFLLQRRRQPAPVAATPMGGAGGAGGAVSTFDDPYGTGAPTTPPAQPVDPGVVQPAPPVDYGMTPEAPPANPMGGEPSVGPDDDTRQLPRP